MISPAIHAVEQLASRVLGPEAASRFEFASIPDDSGREVFEMEGGGSRVWIRGSSVPAMAMGFHWYLKHYAGVHISWRGSHTALPRLLPMVSGVYRRVCWARWRYFLNYCAFSYSMAYWAWEEWELLIDWMALNGINMPLAITGQEAVWERVCKRLSLDDAGINDFLPGPAYLPFGWMGCLDGWGGPLPARWISQHEKLAQDILGRERELGMTPVLQGFTGHIPAALARRNPDAMVHRIQWHEWEAFLVDPKDPLFASVADLFLEEQSRLYGTSHYYAADPFIEMTPPSGDPEYLASLSRAIHAGMTRSDRDAVWIMQGWAFMYKRDFWTQPRMDAFLRAIPDDRMLLLDLHCESEPMWDKTNAFSGKPWLWCNVQNFGGNVQMTAALEANNEALRTKDDPRKGKLSGIGIVNEGLCYSPVAYDFFFEMAWRESEVDLAGWGRAWCRHRYGRTAPAGLPTHQRPLSPSSSAAERAWDILIRTVYSRFQWDCAELLTSPIERVRNADYDWTRPLDECAKEGASVETSRLKDNHRTQDLMEAWRLLLTCAGDLAEVETYRIDLVHVGRQVMANKGTTLKAQIHEAVAAGDLPRFDELAEKIRTLILDMDKLLATHRDFLLGPWLARARRWGDGAAEQARLEWGARRQITLWGDGTKVRDYAAKQWSGLLNDYYLPRWEKYFEAVRTSLQEGIAFDATAFDSRLLMWERAWSDRRLDHRCSEKGDSIAVSREMAARYGAEELAPV